MVTGGLLLRRIRAKWSDQPTGFVWVEKGRLAASGYPASRRQLLWLRKQGIGSILTLTEDPLPKGWLKESELESAHVPMKDHEPPRLEDLDSAVEFVQKQLDSGRSLVVHCMAGRGRTMCVLAGYLMRSKGMEPDEAIRSLRRERANAVEPGQERSLHEYAKLLASRR